MASHAAAEVRRAQILAAALECFGRDGYHEARMDDIVDASGLSKGAIYWHFGSKEEILIALFDAYEREIFAEWEQLPETDALEALRQECEITIRRLLEARSLLATWTEFLRHATLRKRLARVYARSRRRIGETVRRGVKSGQLADCEPEHVAAALTAVIEGFLLQAIADPRYDPLAAWPTTWRLLTHGLVRAGS